ncbi:hypothetical protein BGX28_002191 [Mortierella sp. GBA30]|nr:hypothetical protein BGX28_002191 [Mortierella sp. GBA30]
MKLFLFKVMAVSTALVALPAVLIFGVPLASVIFVPIVVGGAVGGVLLLTGGLIFFVLPILAIGGAFAVWTFSMPAAMTFKELNKILKRANKNADQSSTALSALGPDWEIQPARNNEEWFRWRFPSIGQPVDQLSVRMAVFDPNDKSERKQNTFWLLDKMEGERTDEEEWTLEKTGGSHVQKKSSHFEFRNNSDEFVVENLSVKRDRDHLLIQIEDDGPKILAQKWGKKYLELAKIVDRASSEMEAAHPGLQLGDQVVLVQRKDRGSFWDKFSPYGDLAVRVPFSRNWVHDVTDE